MLTGNASLGDRKDISKIHLIIINKSEISTFQIFIIFFMIVCLKWLFHYVMLISYTCRESWCCISLSLYLYDYLSFFIIMICANNRVHYVPMVVFFSLHIALPNYYEYANVFESIELQKCLSGTFCRECV